MREILFRGKQLDNGDWVEGYYTELPCGSLGATIFSNDDELICEDTKSYIIKVFTKQHTNYSNSNPLQVIECEKYEVIPETIVDFTGLCDKHGKKIFTGDIIYIKCGYGLSAFVGKGIVFFDEKRLQFRVKSIEPSSFDSEKGNIYDECDFTVIDSYEVIGNIYDNPELSKEL